MVDVEEEEVVDTAAALDAVLVAASNAVEVLPVDTQAMLKKVMKTLPLFLHGERHEAGAIMHYFMKEQLTWKRRPEISRMVMRVRMLGT